LKLDISHGSVNLKFEKLDPGVAPGMDKVDLLTFYFPEIF